MFQNTYVAYAAYMIKNYLASNSRRGSATTPPGVRGGLLMELIIIIILRITIISKSVTYDLLMIYL
jgi:hypothetical protein